MEDKGRVGQAGRKVAGALVQGADGIWREAKVSRRSSRTRSRAKAIALRAAFAGVEVEPALFALVAKAVNS